MADDVTMKSITMKADLVQLLIGGKLNMIAFSPKSLFPCPCFLGFGCDSMASKICHSQLFNPVSCQALPYNLYPKAY